MCDSDIVHALGIVGSKTGAHAAGEKNGCNFPPADGIQTDLCKLIFAALNLIEFHRSDRRNLSRSEGGILVVNKLQDRKISILHLLQKLRLLFLVQFIIVLQDMKLSIFLKLTVRILVCHNLFGNGTPVPVPASFLHTFGHGLAFTNMYE